MGKKARKEKREEKAGFDVDLGLGGLLSGLGGLVGKLSDLAEKGEELSRSGEVHFGDPEKGARGIYGVSVKVGLGGEGVKVEPFGNIRRDDATGQSVVQEVREPMVDIFEEEDHTLVVAEMPGIGAGDVKIEVKDDLLTIEAGKGDKKYHKEVLLPRSYEQDQLNVSCNNGVLEIVCSNQRRHQ